MSKKYLGHDCEKKQQYYHWYIVLILCNTQASMLEEMEWHWLLKLRRNKLQGEMQLQIT